MIDFWGDQKFLHPIYPTPVVYSKIIFPTVENAIQATRTEDRDIQIKISKSPPWMARSIGAAINPNVSWFGMRVELMRYFNMQKFGLIKGVGDGYQKMRNALWLLDTGEEPITYWNDNCENFWGKCRCFECHSLDGSRNAYGNILMEVRRIVGENIVKVLDLDRSACNCGNKGYGRCLYTKAWSILSEVFCQDCQPKIEQYCFDESSDGKIDIFYWKSEKNTEPIVNRQVIDNRERSVYVPPNIPYVPHHHVKQSQEVKVEDKWTPLTLKNGRFI